jgi:hypothetical protein
LASTLQHLVERSGGRLAVVLDRRSPLTFGCSLSDAPNEVDALTQIGGIEVPDNGADVHWLGRAVALARRQTEPEDCIEREANAGFIFRWFAGIYCLVVGFDETVSELKLESTVIHALPHVEQLVLALPPLEPEPRGRRSARQPFRVV